MKIHRAGIVLTLALSIVPGCHSTSVVHRASKPLANDSSLSAVVSRRSPKSATTPDAAESADRPSGEVQQVSLKTADAMPATSKPAATRLSIQAAIETALAQNPDLVALRQAEGVGTATLGVAQTYPFNPFVQVQATPYQDAQNAGPGTTYHYVLLMQQIQLGHQQLHREEAACAALNGIRWNVLQAELLNVAQTERLYFAAAYQRGLRHLADINESNNLELLAILERQFADGAATAADVAIVRLDRRSTRQQKRLAEANLQTSLLDLKRHLGLPSDVTFDLDEDIMYWKWQTADSTLLSSLSASRPDVMASRADADAARANVNFADASRIPDLQVGPYYQRNDSGTTFVGFRAQMDIPVINNGLPLLRQREAELTQRAMTAQQLSQRARLEAEAAADRYERARQLVQQPDDTSHADTAIELQRLEEEFRKGEVDILRVLQARNSLLQNRRADLDALNELLQAAVAVTASSGCPLESLTSDREPHQTNSTEAMGE